MIDVFGAKRLRAWLVLLSMAVALPAAAPALPDGMPPGAWPQFGGPNRDFIAVAEDLADSWPESGPEQLWRRDLGEGYSAILVDSGRLYTMYRTDDDDKEAVICLDARTGDTVWEYRYEQAPRSIHLRQYGIGPHSTPLISGDLLFTIGVAGKMHALNKSDGKVLWSRELWGSDFGANILAHGFTSSPLAYKDTVIVPLGGENASIVAFNQTDGSVKWKALSFKNSYSSPRLMEVAGEQQLVMFMSKELIGINPDDGQLRWRYPHANQWGTNITMPMITGGDIIFLSSLQAGARSLRITREGDLFRVEELWSTRRIQFYHGSSVRNGDWVYGTTGSMSPAFMTAINMRTGEIGWRERGFATATCVAADGKLVILDEDGMLYLATATPEKLTVLAKTQLLNRVARTVPTIVGDTMYLRDNKQILAVNLG